MKQNDENRKVTVIRPEEHIAAAAVPEYAPREKTRRVAGYARVSTALEEQQSSYSSQISYYTEFIENHAGWELVGIYTDEGISATSTRRRDGFNAMINDALSGKIDLIITKSVSRFARNTVDSLTAVRQLKDAGIEIYFEKENIWTMDSKGELLITIMSSLAQEESRSISENVTWGHRKRFADGKVSLAYSRFLGYDKGEDGGLVINEQQAQLIRRIYNMYLEGSTFNSIADQLTAENIPTACGKTRWNQSTVRSILTNEKYKGDALLQKSYTVDFLTKKKKHNSGEVAQYYIEHDHEAIIDPHTFELVQAERMRRSVKRSAHGVKYGGIGFFSGRIMCGSCGKLYGTRLWHSNTKYERIVYQCSGKYKPRSACGTKYLQEEEIRLYLARAEKRIKKAYATGESFSGKAPRRSRKAAPLPEFDEELWTAAADHITVYSDGRIELTLKNGASVSI